MNPSASYYAQQYNNVAQWLFSIVEICLFVCVHLSLWRCVMYIQVMHQLSVPTFDQHLVVNGVELTGDKQTLASLQLLPNTVIRLWVSETILSFTVHWRRLVKLWWRLVVSMVADGIWLAVLYIEAFDWLSMDYWSILIRIYGISLLVVYGNVLAFDWMCMVTSVLEYW